MAPEFIAMSLAYGLAVFMLVRLAIDLSADIADRRLSDGLLRDEAEHPVRARVLGPDVDRHEARGARGHARPPGPASG
jgi:hypothetical protein